MCMYVSPHAHQYHAPVHRRIHVNPTISCACPTPHARLMHQWVSCACQVAHTWCPLCTCQPHKLSPWPMFMCCTLVVPYHVHVPAKPPWRCRHPKFCTYLLIMAGGQKRQRQDIDRRLRTLEQVGKAITTTFEQQTTQGKTVDYLAYTRRWLSIFFSIF